MTTTVVFVIFATSFIICMTTMLVAGLLGHFHDIRARRGIDNSVVEHRL